MKKFVILLSLITLFGCDNSEMKKGRKELLSSAGSISSLNYGIEIKKYLIKHDTTSISFDVLDSLRIVSTQRCDTIFSEMIENVYK